MRLKINTLNGLTLKLKSEFYVKHRHISLLGSGSDFLSTYCITEVLFSV